VLNGIKIVFLVFGRQWWDLGLEVNLQSSPVIEFGVLKVAKK
jgi:hypothetical protein